MVFHVQICFFFKRSKIVILLLKTWSKFKNRENDRLLSRGLTHLKNCPFTVFKERFLTVILNTLSIVFSKQTMCLELQLQCFLEYLTHFNSDYVCATALYSVLYNFHCLFLGFYCLKSVLESTFLLVQLPCTIKHKLFLMED